MSFRPLVPVGYDSHFLVLREICFNQDIALDLFWLDGRATLQVVDVSTGYSSCAFLIRKTVEDV